MVDTPITRLKSRLALACSFAAGVALSVQTNSSLAYEIYPEDRKSVV